MVKQACASDQDSNLYIKIRSIKITTPGFLDYSFNDSKDDYLLTIDPIHLKKSSQKRGLNLFTVEQF